MKNLRHNEHARRHINVEYVWKPFSNVKKKKKEKNDENFSVSVQ